MSAVDSIIAFAEMAKTISEEIAEAENALAKKKEVLKRILEEDIPEAMREQTLTKFDLSDGRKISLRDEVFASIKEVSKDQALRWLKENEFGDIIKTQVISSFGKGEESKASKLAEKLLKQFGDEHISMNSTVHPQTLKALQRELMTKGETLPDLYFNVHAVTVAKIT